MQVASSLRWILYTLMKKKLIAEGKLDKHGQPTEKTPSEWLRNVLLPTGGDSVVAGLAAVAETVSVKIEAGIEEEGKKKKKHKDQEDGESRKRRVEEISDGLTPTTAKKTKVEEVGDFVGTEEKKVKVRDEIKGETLEIIEDEKKEKKKKKKKDKEFDNGISSSEAKAEKDMKKEEGEKGESGLSDEKSEKKKKKKKSKEYDDSPSSGLPTSTGGNEEVVDKSEKKKKKKRNKEEVEQE